MVTNTKNFDRHDWCRMFPAHTLADVDRGSVVEGIGVITAVASRNPLAKDLARAGSSMEGMPWEARL